MAPHPASTFETFVASEASQAAFDAALAVSACPGGAHNPLVLYGPTGSGKSHLLGAIVHAMQSRQPDATILTLSGDRLVAQLVHAIRWEQVDALRESIAAADALLLDDVPMRPDNEASREEIARLIDELVARGIQTVIAADAPPAQQRRLETRLRSASCFVLGYPGPAARIEIARRVAATRGVALSEDELCRLATESSGSPRELQSRIARIAAESLA